MMYCTIYIECIICLRPDPADVAVQLFKYNAMIDD